MTNEKYQFQWIELKHTERTHSIRFWVTADAIRVDDKRISVSAAQQQAIADELDASLLTAKISDLIHLHADIRVQPVHATARLEPTLERHSKLIDDLVQDTILDMASRGATLQRPVPLVSGACKDWVLSAKMGHGSQYGIHTTVAHGLHAENGPQRSAVVPWRYRCWASEETAGDHSDRDFLHGVRLVKNDVFVSIQGINGVTWRAARLQHALMHPDYWPLLHHGDRPLRYTRVPTVPDRSGDRSATN